MAANPFTRLFGRPAAEPLADEPFLCIITPVFDGALESIRKQAAELQAQSYGGFFQVLISNGPSPRIKELASGLGDPRFIYDELEAEPVGGPLELFLNICRRRQYAMKRYDAQRYLFLDADAKIIDDGYFMKLHAAHLGTKKDVLMTKVRMYRDGRETILPQRPIIFGNIDLANFSISKKIARRVNYPADHRAVLPGYGSDYRLFRRVATSRNTAMLDFVSTIKDGNSSYQTVTEMLIEHTKGSKPGLVQRVISACLRLVGWR